MDKKTFWIIAGVALAILVLLVVWQTMQINALAASSSSEAVRATSNVAAQSSSAGMVGGC